MRLIDADALIKMLKMQYGDELGWQCTVNMSDVGMMIEDAPTVDAVEVVRCKDCVLRGREDCAMFYRCDCGAQHTWETDNDFCGCGERKESE